MVPVPQEADDRHAGQFGLLSPHSNILFSSAQKELSSLLSICLHSCPALVPEGLTEAHGCGAMRVFCSVHAHHSFLLCIPLHGPSLPFSVCTERSLLIHRFIYQ